MKKRVIFIIACLWVCICFFLIQSTYAKYLTTFDASANVGIAYWNIILNNQNIVKNSDFSANLSLVFPEETYHIADVIVPTAVGYYDLNFDTSNVSLPFTYTISTAVAATNEIADVKVTGYSLDGGTTIIDLPSGTMNVTGSLAANINSYSIRVYVQWFDDNTQTLDDDADTLLAQDGADAIVSVNVSLEQIV